MSDGPRLVPDGLEATLVLLRHGESMAIVEGRFQGRLETPLSPLGLRQAELAGARLANPDVAPHLPIPARPPVEIVHSPLGRTRQTAEAVAGALRTVHGPAAVPALRAEPGLVEIAQGAWEGLHRADVVGRYPDELEAWRRRPTEAHAPGGEPVLDAAVRAREALSAAIARLAEAQPGNGADRGHAAGYPPVHGPDTPWTLLVGHDGIFKAALLALLGLPIERFWIFPWSLTGITVVELVGGRAVLRAHNLTDHLGSLQVEQAAAEARAESEAEARERSGSL